MFKRKTTLPARPPIPSREEIIDDLTQATTDDVVFKLESERIISPLDSDDACSLPEGSDPNNQIEYYSAHQAYIKVASFLEKMNDLEKSLTGLEKNKENLKHLEESLLADMAKVEEEFKKRSET